MFTLSSNKDQRKKLRSRSLSLLTVLFFNVTRFSPGTYSSQDCIFQQGDGGNKSVHWSVSFYQKPNTLRTPYPHEPTRPPRPPYPPRAVSTLHVQMSSRHIASVENVPSNLSSTVTAKRVLHLSLKDDKLPTSSIYIPSDLCSPYFL